MPDYDFGQLYGQADHSGVVLVDKGTYDAVVVKSEWGRTKGGDKGQWTVQVAITTGQFAGAKLTNTITVSPVKDDGTINDKGMGIMYRHLRALGIPVELPGQPLPPGVRNFWEMGWDENTVAQTMMGRPVQIQVTHDNYEDTPRAKIRDYREPRPGAPLQVEKPPQAAAGGNGFGPAQYGGGGGYNPAQYGGGGGGQYQPQGPAAPGPWQSAQQPPQGIPGAPPYAQPPVPGAGGMGEFTGQGQSYQGYQGQQYPPAGGGAGYQPGYNPPMQGGPGYGAPGSGASGQGAPYQPAAPSPSDPYQQQGQPAMPPWAQQPPQPGQPPEQPGQVPPPPWAQ